MAAAEPESEKDLPVEIIDPFAEPSTKVVGFPRTKTAAIHGLSGKLSAKQVSPELRIALAYDSGVKMNTLVTGSPTAELADATVSGPPKFWIVWGVQTCRVYKDLKVANVHRAGVTAPTAISAYATVSEAMAAIAGCGRMVTMNADDPIDTLPTYNAETYWRLQVFRLP